MEKVHKIITGEGSMNVWFNRMMALSQPGYSAEKDPWPIFTYYC